MTNEHLPQITMAFGSDRFKAYTQAQTGGLHGGRAATVSQVVTPNRVALRHVERWLGVYAEHMALDDQYEGTKAQKVLRRIPAHHRAFVKGVYLQVIGCNSVMSLEVKGKDRDEYLSLHRQIPPRGHKLFAFFSRPAAVVDAPEEQPPEAPTVEDLERLARESVADFVQMASKAFGRPVSAPPVSFDLKGQKAGMASSLLGLFFNRILMTENAEDFLRQTVGHEVAHWVCWELFPDERGHGHYWKNVMRAIGLEPLRTHSYDVSRAQVRKVKRPYVYTCGCREHHLTGIRHKRAAAMSHIYGCQQCGEKLTYSHTEA